MLLFLFGKRTSLKIRPKYFKLQAGIIFPSPALGFSTFVMQASESIILICFNSSLYKYGGDIAVGAMTVLSSVMQFAMLPLQGLGQGAQPIISYNYGAKNSARVKKAFKLLLISSLCYSVTLWALVMAIPQAFVMMFNTNEGLVSYTVPALRIYLGALLLFGIQIACQMTFTSMGNATASVIVRWCASLCCFCPSSISCRSSIRRIRRPPSLWRIRLRIQLRCCLRRFCSFSNSAGFCARWAHLPWKARKTAEMRAKRNGKYMPENRAERRRRSGVAFLAGNAERYKTMRAG